MKVELNSSRWWFKLEYNNNVLNNAHANIQSLQFAVKLHSFLHKKTLNKWPEQPLWMCIKLRRPYDQNLKNSSSWTCLKTLQSSCLTACLDYVHRSFQITINLLLFFPSSKKLFALDPEVFCGTNMVLSMPNVSYETQQSMKEFSLN